MLSGFQREMEERRKTPVLVLSQSKRERINLISAVTNRGSMRLMLYRENMTAEVLIRFMQQLIKDAKRKVLALNSEECVLLGLLITFLRWTNPP